MRRSVGTAMLWGAFGVTLFGIFLTPVFFYVIAVLPASERPRSYRPKVEGSRPVEEDRPKKIASFVSRCSPEFS